MPFYNLASYLFISLPTKQTQEEESSHYCLVEVSQVEGVRERVLCDTEYPWKSLQDLRKVNNNKQTSPLKDVLYIFCYSSFNPVY